MTSREFARPTDGQLIEAAHRFVCNDYTAVSEEAVGKLASRIMTLSIVGAYVGIPPQNFEEAYGMAEAHLLSAVSRSFTDDYELVKNEIIARGLSGDPIQNDVEYFCLMVLAGAKKNLLTAKL